jgi:serine phosphatase RsbU (regulator of sigma subunit)
MMVVILRPGTNRVTVLRAGHPGMLLHGPDTVEWIEPMGGPALGVVPNMEQWPVHEMYLPPDHGLILLTDGLFEGHSGQGNERLGEAGLLKLARSIPRSTPESFVDSLIDGAEQLAQSHGGLADDVAVLRVQRSEKETGV